MEDKVNIIAQDGKKEEYDVLFSFEIANKKYIVYTDYLKDDDGNIITHSAEYANATFLPIKDEEALKIVDEMMKTLNNAKKRYKLND